MLWCSFCFCLKNEKFYWLQHFDWFEKKLMQSLKFRSSHSNVFWILIRRCHNRIINIFFCFHSTFHLHRSHLYIYFLFRVVQCLKTRDLHSFNFIYSIMSFQINRSLKRIDDVEREFQSMSFSRSKRTRLKKISILITFQKVHIDQFNVSKSRRIIRSTSLLKTSSEEKKTCKTWRNSTRNEWLIILLSYDNCVCLFMIIMQKSHVILNRSRRAVKRRDKTNHDQFFNHVRHCKISKRMNSTMKWI